MRVGTIAVCLTLGLGLTAGCSDDGSSDNADGTTTSEDSMTSTTSGESDSEAQRAEDEAAAEEIVLTLDDFESGWEASPSDEEDESDEQIQDDLADCLGVDREEIDPDYPSADSPDFASTDDEEVSASVSYAPSVEDAEDAVELYRHEDLPSCFVEAMKASMLNELQNPPEGEEPPEDLEIGEPTFNPISFGDLGDETVAYRATVPFSASGIDLEVYFDVVLVRVGRVGIEATFQSTFSPFPTDEAERYVGIMVDRVPADA